MKKNLPTLQMLNPTAPSPATNVAASSFVSHTCDVTCGFTQESGHFYVTFVVVDMPEVTISVRTSKPIARRRCTSARFVVRCFST